ncbi:flagellin [Sneathiella chinensis]|uniref:Flagellin n=1 Tax=Sneathiella chinensis TaxID=349750 RepID=A0ABQ5U1M9_9PROT|nr:flagellin [Sneathiella chinensis]GLQ05585.1 flagellin [Sneathiella chinensis]
MAFSVNTNVTAMAALRTLTSTQGQLDSIQRQIETGLKVAEAKDDPSTFTIAQGMRGDVGSLKAIQEGLSFGQATVNMANAGALQISNTIIDLNKKVTQGFNDGLDTDILQEEADALIDQINSIVNTTIFNGVNLIDGSGTDLEVLSALGGVTQTVPAQDATVASLGLTDFSLESQAATLTLENGFAIADANVVELTLANGDVHTFEMVVGPRALNTPVNEANGQYVHAVTIDPANQSTNEMLGIMANVMRQEGFAVTLTEDGVVEIATGQEVTITNSTLANATVGVYAGDPLAVLENAEMLVGQIITTLGTAANRLESQSEFTQLLVDKLEEGLGILVDANLAEASAELQALQTKEQLGVQSLSIANSRPQSILSLFQ